MAVKAPPKSPKTGTIWDVLRIFNNRLDAHVMAAERRMTRSYQDAIQRLEHDYTSISRQVADARAAGEPVSPSWLYRQDRYLELTRQIEDEMARFAGNAGDILANEQRKAAELGIRAQSQLSQASFATIPPGFDKSVWVHADTRAHTAMSAWLSSTQTAMFEHSPLAKLINAMPVNAQNAVSSALSNGILLGWGPDKMAREMRAGTDAVSIDRAQLISRTETMRAYRAAQAAGFAANDTVSGWRWVAKLDGRTCAVCYIMHGKEFAKEDVLPGHPNCRCAMVPVTKSWDELGFPGVPESSPDFGPKGVTVLNRMYQSGMADDVRRILGPTRFGLYEQWLNGKGGMSPSDMVVIGQHPEWGSTAMLAPIQRSAKTPTFTPNTARPATSGVSENPDDYAKFNTPGEAQSWGNSTYRSWGQSLTDDEAGVLGGFQGGYYTTLNKTIEAHLEGKNSFGSGHGLVEIDKPYSGRYGTVREDALKMQGALGRAEMPFDAQSWRGMSDRIWKGKTVGDSVTRNTFASTSMHFDTAAGFAAGHGPDSVIVRFLIPKGTKGAWLEASKNGTDMGEYEWVMQAGHTWRIVRDERVAGTYSREHRYITVVVE